MSSEHLSRMRMNETENKREKYILFSVEIHIKYHVS